MEWSARAGYEGVSDIYPQFEQLLTLVSAQFPHAHECRDVTYLRIEDMVERRRAIPVVELLPGPVLQPDGRMGQSRTVRRLCDLPKHKALRWLFIVEKDPSVLDSRRAMLTRKGVDGGVLLNGDIRPPVPG